MHLSHNFVPLMYLYWITSNYDSDASKGGWEGCLVPAVKKARDELSGTNQSSQDVSGNLQHNNSAANETCPDGANDKYYN